MTSFDDHVTQLLGDTRHAQGLVQGVVAATKHREVTVRSRNRMVSATVDAQGRLHGLVLHGDGYKKLPGAELAALVVETVEEARQECQADVMQALRESLGDEVGVDFDALVNQDPGELLSATVFDERAGLSAGERQRFETIWAEGR